MKLHPRVTPAAVDLVKRFEGFRPRAAKTPEGRFTIGYGHLLSPRDSADEAAISEPEAEFLLKHDLAVTADAIEDALLAPVNDNQFAALLSFAFNIGVDNFKGCSALRRLNEGAYLQAAAALELWRRADFGGEVLVVDQLVRRRAVEKALFLAPPEGFMPLPSSVLRPAFDHSVIGAAVAWAAARERTAVSRIALEGPDTALGLATPPGREGEPAPSAAIAAADALAIRLSRILPEDETHSEEPPASESLAPPENLAAPETPALWSLEAEDAAETDVQPEAEADATPVAPVTTFTSPSRIDPTSATSQVRADALLEDFAPAPAEPSMAAEPKAYDSGFDLPPPPSSKFEDAAATETHPAASVEEGAAEFPQVAKTQVESAEAEPATEPPPFVAEEAAAEPALDPALVTPWRRRFPRAAVQDYAFGAADNESSPSLFDPPPVAAIPPLAPSPGFAPTPATFDAFEDAPAVRVGSAFADAPTTPPTPLFERPIFFQVLGLIGIALFAGSIFCMIHRASFACLLIGVVGILAMAPAAAFFLFRFLGQPVDTGAAEHADLATMMRDPSQPTSHGEAAEEVASNTTEATDSPFDNAWR